MYAIGMFAKKTGVTIRTLRFYDEKNLLRPSYVAESGRRYYKDEDIPTLQKILTLKFLGLSLEEIERFIRENDWNLHDSLLYQKQQLEQKRAQIDQSIQTLEHAILLAEKNETVDAHIFFIFIQNMRMESSQKDWLKNVYPEEIVEDLYNFSPEETSAYNAKYMDITKQLKQAYARDAADEEVIAIFKELLNIVPAELLTQLMEASEGVHVELDNDLFASPFTKEEEAWMERKLAKFNLLDELKEGDE